MRHALSPQRPRSALSPSSEAPAAASAAAASSAAASSSSPRTKQPPSRLFAPSQPPPARRILSSDIGDTMATATAVEATQGAAAGKNAEFEALVLRLHEIEAVKFGSFKLKSGITSPVYVDLRLIVSYPDVLSAVADAMWARVKTEASAEFDNICGVPYTALPIATCMSLQHKVPMLMRRKEVKDYGTKKAIEGAFTRGQKCLIVEDLVTSGASVMETVEPLEAEGLHVTDVVVLIDREQGGAGRMASNGLRLHSAFTLSYLLEVLTSKGLVDASTAKAVEEFIAANQTFDATAPGNEPKPPRPPPSSSSVSAAAPAAPSAPAEAAARKTFKRLPFEERAALAQCPAGRALFELMARKKTNLAVAADVPSTDEVLRLADAAGPHIAVFKTHVDAQDRWTPRDAEALAALAAKHDFLIFEDRKFADIGNTVVSQYGAGPFKIAEWSHLTNAHLLPGPGIIDGLKSVGKGKQRGLLLLAEMSSAGALTDEKYAAEVAAAAENNLDFVCGFISQRPASWAVPASPGLVHMTPGVQLAAGGDALGQQYNTPSSVVGVGGTDVIIVGRGIVKATDPGAAAKEYREAGWSAYEEALKG